MAWIKVCALTGALLVAGYGCGLVSTQGSDHGGSGGGGSTDADMKQYDELQARLDQHRTEFLGKSAMELASTNDRLFWLEFPGWDPVLHSSTLDGPALKYGFSIGDGDTYNYRAGTAIIATVEPASDTQIVRAYAVGAANQPLGELSLPAAKSGQRWSAYAVDGNVVYVVTADPGSTALGRWTPGQNALTPVLKLEDLGMEVGEFIDFGVDGNQMFAIESGRLWVIDIQGRKAKWIGNKTEASGMTSWDQNGLIAQTAAGPCYYRFATGELVDLKARIAANAYHLNATYTAAHQYLQDGMMFRGGMVYIADSGVFTYDVEHDTITPVLLEPRAADVRIEYRYPTVVGDAIFVVGLTSTSGSVGADGPVYRVDL